MKLWKVEKFSAKKCQKHFYSSLSDARVKTISLSSIFAWIQRQFSNSEQKMKLLLFLIEILCNGNRHNTNNLNDSFKDSFQMKGFHSPPPICLSLSFFLSPGGYKCSFHLTGNLFLSVFYFSDLSNYEKKFRLRSWSWISSQSQKCHLLISSPI